MDICSRFCKIHLESHWWNNHSPSFHSIATLRSYKTALVGCRSLGRYLYQSSKSWDQSRTLLKSISVVHFVQIRLEGHWWNIHPPSFHSFANLRSYLTALIGFRSLGRYLYRSSKSRDQSRTLLKSISVVHFVQIRLEGHWWNIHPPPSPSIVSRLWEADKLPWLALGV